MIFRLLLSGLTLFFLFSHFYSFDHVYNYSCILPLSLRFEACGSVDKLKMENWGMENYPICLPLVGRV